jgi:hypothetical protein
MKVSLVQQDGVTKLWRSHLLLCSAFGRRIAEENVGLKEKGNL